MEKNEKKKVWFVNISEYNHQTMGLLCISYSDTYPIRIKLFRLIWKDFLLLHHSVAQISPELHFRFINSFISNHLCQNLCPHQNFLHSGALIHSTYDIRSIRHLSRSWQKKWMYVRQPNLFQSRSSHIVSMKFHRVHTYIFLDPFLFACDSLSTIDEFRQWNFMMGHSAQARFLAKNQLQSNEITRF